MCAWLIIGLLPSTCSWIYGVDNFLGQRALHRRPKLFMRYG
jgi:hypothetical protein